jgi:tetratricopeptide (TPR) repeat protein
MPRHGTFAGRAHLGHTRIGNNPRGRLMAEGVLGDLLGGEEEAGESATGAELLAGADAYAIAMAIEQARHDPKVAAATLVFLEKQARLLEVQTAQLSAESSLRLHHLRGQSRESHVRRMGQLIRLGMQVFVALIATMAGIFLLVMLRDAFTSHAVVVEAFDAPAALAPQGFTGKVIATGVLDALQKLSDATRSQEKALTSYSAWSSDIEIEVPETGVSIGEIDRLLHQRFGHDIHIAGDLVQSAGGGLVLTIRGDGVPPKSFSGAAGDIEKLTTAASEYVYGNSQPYDFASYLTGHGRDQDALAFLPGAFAAATSDPLKSKLANIWGNAYSDLNQPAQAADKYRLAVSLDPDNWLPRLNLPSSVAAADGEEAGWRAATELLHAASRTPGTGPAKRYLGNAASLTWDLPLLLEANLADSAYNKGAGATTLPAGPAIADAYAMMHDPAAAARYMAASDPADPNAVAELPLLQAYAALDRNDAPAALPPMEAFWKIWQASPLLQSNDLDYPCLLVLVYGLVNRPADAGVIFNKAGKWNRCYAFYGYALARANDLQGATRIWAEGQRLAPDLPFVYLYRGLSEATRNETAQAAADFAAANHAAPHLAEPLKAWGDLLASQGHWNEALAKYDAALTNTPKWEALKNAREIAASNARAAAKRAP